MSERETSGTAGRMQVGGRSNDGEGTLEAYSAGAVAVAGVTQILHSITDVAGDRVYGYLDGVEVLDASASFVASSHDVNDSQSGSIGAEDDCTSKFMDGVVDEVRVSRGALSTDWIETDYDNFTSDSGWITIGTTFTVSP